MYIWVSASSVEFFFDQCLLFVKLPECNQKQIY